MKYNLLETGSHTVYALQYHFVTVTKYRADLLTDEIAERVGEIASDISEDFGVNIQNVNGGSDHVHILFTAKPTTDLTKFINSLKGVTSRKIRDENPEVRQALDKAFWQPGYFLTTTGQVSIDVLMEYVEEQRVHDRHVTTLQATFAPPPRTNSRKQRLLETYLP